MHSMPPRRDIRERSAPEGAARDAVAFACAVLLASCMPDTVRELAQTDDTVTYGWPKDRHAADEAYAEAAAYCAAEGREAFFGRLDPRSKLRQSKLRERTFVCVDPSNVDGASFEAPDAGTATASTRGSPEEAR